MLVVAGVLAIFMAVLVMRGIAHEGTPLDPC
jgi:hypothetical protein